MEKRFKAFMIKHTKLPLCGRKSPLGKLANLACIWTETPLEQTQYRGDEVRCWCCCYWRGVVTGVLFTALLWMFYA